MLFVISLIPATIWVALGYFILYSSTKTQGVVQKFGQVLAVWVFLVAALIPMMGGYATFAGFDPIRTMQSMHSGRAPGLRPPAQKF